MPRLQDEANEEAEKWNEGDRVLVEVMVRPDSNLVTDFIELPISSEI